MTDHDLNARLARMETSLRHIMQDVQDAKKERADETRQTQDFIARLVRLEAGDKALSGLPDRVAHAEATNDVQDAVKKAYEQFEARQAQRDRDLKNHIVQKVGAVVSILALVTTAAWHFIGNGP